jgi:hypothetical protein
MLMQSLKASLLTMAILTDKEKLRALEVNAWQLMRLLRVRSPKSPCLGYICSKKTASKVYHETTEDRDIAKFCSLFDTAQDMHKRWKASPCKR